MAGTIQLNLKQAISLTKAVGFSGTKLIIAVSVMGAESGRFVDNVGVNADGSRDRGLFQINDKAHPLVTDEIAFNAWLNTSYAYILSNGGRNWGPWAAYTAGRYLINVPKVTAEFAKAKAGLWATPLEERVARIRTLGEAWRP